MPDAENNPAILIGPVRTADDLAATAGLFRAYAASLEVDLSYQAFAGELAGLPGAYAPPDGALLLACDTGGVPVGCIALRSMAASGQCEMKRLYVAPEGRGLGVGRALAVDLIAEARRIGYTGMRLDTLPSMDQAQRLYKRLGFVPIDPHYETPITGTVFLGLSLIP